MRELFSKDMQQTIAKMRFSLFRSQIESSFGLYGGKMGYAILFYEYSRFTQNSLFKQIADEQIDSIMHIPSNISLKISDGLAGIGWGILYLKREKYIDCDLDSLLYPIDECLFQPCSTDEEDVASILSYLDFRISHFEDECNSLSRYQDIISGYNAMPIEIFSEDLILSRIWNI